MADRKATPNEPSKRNGARADGVMLNHERRAYGERWKNDPYQSAGISGMPLCPCRGLAESIGYKLSKTNQENRIPQLREEHEKTG